MTKFQIDSFQIAPFDCIKLDMQAATPAQLMQKIANLIAPPLGLNPRILTDRATSHIKLQNPVLGDGIALTQLRVSGLDASFQVFVRLKAPVAMNAPDNRDVDLFCLLLSPEREAGASLRTVSRLSRFFRDPLVQGCLRSASSEGQIQALFEKQTISIAA